MKPLTKSRSDGAEVRWYFSRAPLKKGMLAASLALGEVVAKGEFTRFSKEDSLALEAAYLAREEEFLSAWWKEYALVSEGPAASQTAASEVELGTGGVDDDASASREETSGVVVKGGLFEVDLMRRRCYPVYWKGEDTRVLRGSWFAKKGTDWTPLREDVAEQLEYAYRSHVWRRRTFQPSGLYAARVSLGATVNGSHALITGEDNTWEAWYNDHSSGFQSFLGLSSTASINVPLRRGFLSVSTEQPSPEELRQQKEEQMDDYASRVPIKHVVFMIHGIGQRLEKANLVSDVGLFQQACTQMAEQHLTEHQRDTQRILFIPVQWRRGLVLAGESLVDDITMEGLRGIRETVNRTVLDVLYYMSPAYRQDIVNSVTSALNGQFRRFLKRNPGYDGKISLWGHSLGSVLCYDILCHQEEEDEKEGETGEGEPGWEREGEAARRRFNPYPCHVSATPCTWAPHMGSAPPSPACCSPRSVVEELFPMQVAAGGKEDGGGAGGWGRRGESLDSAQSAWDGREGGREEPGHMDVAYSPHERRATEESQSGGERLATTGPSWEQTRDGRVGVEGGIGGGEVREVREGGWRGGGGMARERTTFGEEGAGGVVRGQGGEGEREGEGSSVGGGGIEGVDESGGELGGMSCGGGNLSGSPVDADIAAGPRPVSTDGDVAVGARLGMWSGQSFVQEVGVGETAEGEGEMVSTEESVVSVRGKLAEREVGEEGQGESRDVVPQVQATSDRAEVEAEAEGSLEGVNNDPEDAEIPLSGSPVDAEVAASPRPVSTDGDVAVGARRLALADMAVGPRPVSTDGDVAVGARRVALAIMAAGSRPVSTDGDVAVGARPVALADMAAGPCPVSTDGDVAVGARRRVALSSDPILVGPPGSVEQDETDSWDDGVALSARLSSSPSFARDFLCGAGDDLAGPGHPPAREAGPGGGFALRAAELPVGVGGERVPAGGGEDHRLEVESTAGKEGVEPREGEVKEEAPTPVGEQVVGLEEDVLTRGMVNGHLNIPPQAAHSSPEPSPEHPNQDLQHIDHSSPTSRSEVHQQRGGREEGGDVAETGEGESRDTRADSSEHDPLEEKLDEDDVQRGVGKEEVSESGGVSLEERGKDGEDGESDAQAGECTASSYTADVALSRGKAELSSAQAVPAAMPAGDNVQVAKQSSATKVAPPPQLRILSGAAPGAMPAGDDVQVAAQGSATKAARTPQLRIPSGAAVEGGEETPAGWGRERAVGERMAGRGVGAWLGLGYRIGESDEVGGVASTSMMRTCACTAGTPRRLRRGRREDVLGISYPLLDFKVDTFFAVGSPVGLFLALRNVRLGLGVHSNKEGMVEEMPACRVVMNIFHPFDPVAYRVEPLVSKEFVKRRPMHIPFHKGGKKIHIGVQEATEQLCASSRALGNRIWTSIASLPAQVAAAWSAESAEKASSVAGDEESVVKLDDHVAAVMARLSGDRDGRLDFMLQDDTFQHQYLAALSSHTAYWGDPDTALFVVKHLYKDIPREQPTTSIVQE